MCQVHYLWETERDFLFIIVMLSRVETQWRLYGGKKLQTRGLIFTLTFFWSVMITNSSKAEKAGTGYNDLFVMQIPPLSSLPKINKPKQMTICGGAQLSTAGSLVADRFLLSAQSLLLRV